MTINKERRTFIRVDLPLDCIIKTQEETINATCKNLSATGMSIELKDGSLKINDSIQVILNDNQEAVPALNATAKVVRIINEDLKQYGIAFIASE
ncbi:MAG: PilZ domain-containing protein [Succinivibrionaceae bacterium]|nr:PilZ domain-containing protein [Succinivibrionaceae bacterium]